MLDDDQVIEAILDSNIEPYHLVGFLQLAGIDPSGDVAGDVRALALASNHNGAFGTDEEALELLLAWFASDADFDDYIEETPVMEDVRRREDAEARATMHRLEEHYDDVPE